MAQQHKLGTGHTTVSTINGKTSIVFWNTEIVSFNEKTITLNTGGFFTATTKTRMNQAASQFNLPYHVTQKAGTWYVNEMPFIGNIVKLARN